LCPLEHGFDRLLAGTAAHSGQVTQLFQLLRVEVGHDGALEERLNYLRFIGLLYCRPHRGGVVFEFVDSAAMGKDIDPRCAVGPAQDLGDAVAVVGAFVWVRQGSALEAIRIGQDVGDGAAGELFVVERENEVGQQDAFELALDNAFDGQHRHALPKQKASPPASSRCHGC
jgi:hypothetical protein